MNKQHLLEKVRGQIRYLDRGDHKAYFGSKRSQGFAKDRLTLVRVNIRFGHAVRSHTGSWALQHGCSFRIVFSPF
jgi:hypothetical protein